MHAIIDSDAVAVSTSSGSGSTHTTAARPGELASSADLGLTPSPRQACQSVGARQTPPTLAVRTFGAFQIRGRDGWIDGPPANGGGDLILRLIMSPSRSVSRDDLISLGRSDQASDSATHRTHLAASGARAFLRRCLGATDLIQTTRAGYALHKDATVESDFARFTEAYCRRNREAYLVAIALYRGAFLAGEASGWVQRVRRRYASMHVEMLISLAQGAIEAGDFNNALGHSSAVGAVDCGHEGAARIAMRCYAGLGQRALVRAEYESLQVYLRTQCDTEPSLETRTLYYSLVR